MLISTVNYMLLSTFYQNSNHNHFQSCSTPPSLDNAVDSSILLIWFVNIYHIFLHSTISDYPHINPHLITSIRTMTCTPALLSHLLPFVAIVFLPNQSFPYSFLSPDPHYAPNLNFISNTPFWPNLSSTTSFFLFFPALLTISNIALFPQSCTYPVPVSVSPTILDPSVFKI